MSFQFHFQRSPSPAMIHGQIIRFALHPARISQDIPEFYLAYDYVYSVGYVLLKICDILLLVGAQFPERLRAIAHVDYGTNNPSLDIPYPKWHEFYIQNPMLAILLLLQVISEQLPREIKQHYQRPLALVLLCHQPSLFDNEIL